MKWLALIAIFGCTRSSEVKTEAKTELRAEENVTQTVQTGPSETTIYKFALPSPTANIEGTDSNTPHEDARPVAFVSLKKTAQPGSAPAVPTELKSSQHMDLLPPHGPLVEMDVIRTEGSLSTTVAAATTTAATDSHSDATKASSVGLSWKFYAAGVLVVLLLAGAAYVLWRAKMFTL